MWLNHLWLNHPGQWAFTKTKAMSGQEQNNWRHDGGSIYTQRDWPDWRETGLLTVATIPMYGIVTHWWFWATVCFGPLWFSQNIWQLNGTLFDNATASMVSYRQFSIINVCRQLLNTIPSQCPTHGSPRNLELRNGSRFQAALTAALQLASGSKELGDQFKAIWMIG